MLRTLGSVALLTLLAPTALAQNVGDTPPPGTPRWVLEGRPGVAPTPEQEDAALLRAARILDRRGWHGEAAHLREIAGMPRGARGPGHRLADANLEDRMARIRMVEHLAKSYGRIGWESNAASLNWLAQVAKAQAARSSAPLPPPPPGLEGLDAPGLQAELTRIVQRGVEAFRANGEPEAARIAERLGAYYAERQAKADAARAEQVTATDEPAQEPTPDRSQDVGYIEGRLPILEVAAEAYATRPRDGDAEAGAILDWMVEVARARVVDGAPEPGPMPEGLRGMDQIIELIRGAGDRWEELRQPENAERCRRLADFYVARDKGEAIDHSAPRRTVQQGVDAVGVEEEPVVDSAPRDATLQRIEEFRREAESLRRAIAELEAELARTDG